MRYLLIPALVAAALLVAWLDSESGIRTYLQLRSEVRGADARLDALRTENSALEAEAQALETSEFAAERAIREELAWAKPGETVVRLAPAQPAQAGVARETP